jgi:hypothetical protein
MNADIRRGALAIAVLLAPANVARADDASSPSTRFSRLTEITPGNVSRLAVAWTAHTGELAGGEGPTPSRPVEGFQCRPVLAGDLLVITTPTSKVIALDPETGAERWRFDPFAGRRRTCEFPHRGVSLWEGATAAERTLFSGTCDGRLVALDPKTGSLRTDFAAGGVLDLRPAAPHRVGRPQPDLLLRGAREHRAPRSQGRSVAGRPGPGRRSLFPPGPRCRDHPRPPAPRRPRGRGSRPAPCPRVASSARRALRPAARLAASLLSRSAGLRP